MFALGGAYAFVRRDVDGQISVRPLTGPPPAMSSSVRVSLTSAFTNRLRVKGMDRCNFEDRCYFSAERALGSVRVGFLIRRAELPKRELVRHGWPANRSAVEPHGKTARTSALAAGQESSS